MSSLGVKPPNRIGRVTEHINEIFQTIEGINKNGNKNRKLKSKKTKSEGRTWGVQTLDLCDGMQNKLKNEMKNKNNKNTEIITTESIAAAAADVLTQSTLPCTDILIEMKAQGTFTHFRFYNKFFIFLYFLNTVTQFANNLTIIDFNFINLINWFLFLSLIFIFI